MTLRIHRKKILVTVISMAMGGVAMSAQAALTSSASLSFDAGTPVVTGCLAGSIDPTTGNCTLGTALNVTDMGGSFFSIDADESGTVEPNEKTAISMFEPLHIGTTQTSSGQHTGTVNGSENPAIDNAWNFLGNTGMHTLTSPISVISNFGSTKTLDLSGWGWNWGDFGPGGTEPTISIGGVATIVCSTSSCSDGDTYTLDMNVHMQSSGFTSAPYSLHLEGIVNSPVPVPAAVWLFGSGLLGLVGIARRKKAA